MSNLSEEEFKEPDPPPSSPEVNPTAKGARAPGKKGSDLTPLTLLDSNRMDERFSDSEYRSFNRGENDEEANIPSRYSKGKTSEERSARSQARAEARRTRRTLRLQQKQQEEQQRQQQKQEQIKLAALNSGDQHYKLSVSDSSDESSIDENYDVASIPESITENLTWRGRMQHALHNHWFHLVIVILVCLDALIVIFELLIDVGAFGNVLCEGENFLERAETCHYRDSALCGPHALMILEEVNISASPDGNGEEICDCGFRAGQRVCILSDDYLGLNPAIVLHITSILILSTFLVEILLKLIAFRLKYFVHKFEIFDGFIVVISWIFDVASIVEEEAFEAASLLIVLRLWRVVRIVNGAVLSSKAQADRDLEDIRSEARKIIHAFHKAQDRMDDLEAENINLKKKRGKEREVEKEGF